MSGNFAINCHSKKLKLFESKFQCMTGYGGFKCSEFINMIKIKIMKKIKYIYNQMNSF